MTELQVPSTHVMLEWVEQRRLALIAAYRAVLLANEPRLTVEQLNDAVERWSDFALGRSRTLTSASSAH